MSVIGVVLVIWILLCAVVVAGCVLGGRVDDRTEQDVEREAHYTNLATVYQHPRALR